jgi:hypothetical protein
MARRVSNGEEDLMSGHGDPLGSRRSLDRPVHNSDDNGVASAPDRRF